MKLKQIGKSCLNGVKGLEILLSVFFKCLFLKKVVFNAFNN